MEQGEAMTAAELRRLLEGVPDTHEVVVQLAFNECIPVSDVDVAMYREEDPKDGYGTFIDEIEAEIDNTLYQENAVVLRVPQE